MVLGYHCEDCGIQRECDVAGPEDDHADGERLCPECGEWVSGITGRARQGMEFSGNILWAVGFGYAGERTRRYEAHDWYGAAEQAHEDNDAGDKAITSVTPVENHRV